MELTEAVRRRRMVRRYDATRPIPREILEPLVRLGVRGPSAGFSQGVEFLVLATPGDLDRYWTATTSPDVTEDSWLAGMRTAQALILCLSDKSAYLERYAQPDKGWADRAEDRWPIPYWDVDAGMGAMLVLLGAVDEGLGACFFGVPGTRHDAVRSAFGLPDRLRMVGVVSLGYPALDEHPAGSGTTRLRRPVRETVHFGRHGGRWVD